MMAYNHYRRHYIKRPTKKESAAALELFSPDALGQTVTDDPPKKKAKRLDLEFDTVHVPLTWWIADRWPDLIFRSDLGGVYLAHSVSSKADRLLNEKGYPDLFIASGRGGYNGLYLELKFERSSYLKLDGQLRKNEHLTQQLNYMVRLRAAGYCAYFATGMSADGINEAEQIITWYMSLPPNPLPTAGGFPGKDESLYVAKEEDTATPERLPFDDWLKS